MFPRFDVNFIFVVYCEFFVMTLHSLSKFFMAFFKMSGYSSGKFFISCIVKFDSPSAFACLQYSICPFSDPPMVNMKPLL